MPLKNKTSGERLAVIETEVGHIKGFMLDIKDNHLHSIYIRLTNFEKVILSRLPGWATALITILSSIVTGLIIYGVMR